jgi:hypothetical protein
MKVDFKTNSGVSQAGQKGYPFKWTSHPNIQFLNYVNAGIEGRPARFVFKAHNPWRIITPPGYSVLQLPLFYHFNPDITVLPGIIHTDIHHEANLQILYHSDSPELFLKRGFPMVQYIPFKRNEKFELSVRDASLVDRSLFSKQINGLLSVFDGEYRYRQRKQDKNLNVKN